MNSNLDPETYARRAGFDGSWRDTWWNPDFLDLMARRWGLSEAHTMLDVGCGHGHWGRGLLPFLPEGVQLVGVDVEWEFAAAAAAAAAQRARGLGAAGLGRRAQYATAEVTRLPFPSNSFDLVTCQTLLIHVPAARAAVDELLRVLRPGGVLAVAEPNNIANVAAMSLCEPRPPLADYLGLIELQWVCEAGKQVLGDGESSIGERLPQLFTEAGLENVRTFGSDKCATLVPPYSGTQRLDLDTVAGWARDGIWMYVGDESRARELFAAGGGAPEDFERLWGCVRRHLERFHDAAQRGAVSGTRGIAMYLVSGRKSA